MKEHIQRASVFQNRFLGSSVHMVMRKVQEKSAKIFSRDRQEGELLANGNVYAYFSAVSEVTRILNELGTAQSAEELLPLVYAELKRIAAHKMASEPAGHTLQPTALVHEAWLSLAGTEGAKFQNRAHFFAAAAEAMRRILVDSARRKRSLKRGAAAVREEIQEDHWVQDVRSDELLAVDEALDLLAREDPVSAELVKLRYFVGMNMDEAAAALDLPLRTTERMWTFARAWLRSAISGKADSRRI